MSVTINDIRSHLTKLGLLPVNESIADSDSLFDSDIIDSIRLMELIMLLETEYQITVNQDDLVPENFDSIENISRYMSERLRSAVVN